MIPENRQENESATIGVGDDYELINWGWEPVAGERVEVRRPGHEVRRGVIGAVMKDTSGFWLAADGVEPREFVILADKEQRIRHTPTLTPG
jgi:hypothetical protein